MLGMRAAGASIDHSPSARVCSARATGSGMNAEAPSALASSGSSNTEQTTTGISAVAGSAFVSASNAQPSVPGMRISSTMA